MPVPTQLRALQALELALRKGSLRAAAEALSITPAAVGQRIRALEEYLGYELISRGRNGTRPTRELQPALAHLGAAFRELETVARLLDFQRVNEIHITADSDWAQLWLLPRLEGFKKANPNVLFCVNGVGDVPLRIGKADCTVGFELDESIGEIDQLHRDYLLPVTSPVNATRIMHLPEDKLEGFPLLHLDVYANRTDEMDWPTWTRRFGHRKSDPERGIRYQWVVQALEAVYADAGFILCGLSLIQTQIAQGTLSTPFPLIEGEWSKKHYQVRYTHDALSRSGVQKFRQWLTIEAAKTNASLEDALST